LLKLFALTAIAVITVGTSTAHAAENKSERMKLVVQIESLINSTWHRQEVMGIHKTRTVRSYRGKRASLAYTKWVYKHWKRINNVTIRTYRNPPYLQAFLCIHHYEGPWTDNYSPFWGGLQMDSDFQASYGSMLLRTKGTANHWTPLEQIWTATKAVRSRGFYPWPNTARMCGLL
jgi:hypothetical protein